jgi:organic radical activating enzyme
MLSKEIQLEVNKGAMLPLMEEFYTIQGEGFQGTAAYFVRIGGCDVGCHWCDVKSWNANCILRQHQSDCIQCKYSETVV